MSRRSLAMGIAAVAIVGGLVAIARQLPAGVQATADGEEWTPTADAVGRSGSAGHLERRHQHAAATARRPRRRKRCSPTRKPRNSQKQLAHDLTRDRRDGGAQVDVNRAYNEHWMDARRLKITADERTSLIVDPPDGQNSSAGSVDARATESTGVARAPANATLQRRPAGRTSTDCPAAPLHHPDRPAAVPADDLQQQLPHLPEPRLRRRSRRR